VVSIFILRQIVTRIKTNGIYSADAPTARNAVANTNTSIKIKSTGRPQRIASSHPGSESKELGIAVYKDMV